VAPEAALGPPEMVLAAPVECAVRCPLSLPEVWLFDATPAAPDEPVVAPVLFPSRPLTLPAVCESGPAVVEWPISALGAWAPDGFNGIDPLADPVVGPVADSDAGAAVWFALDAPFRDVVTALPDPVPCGAGCATVEPREIALITWEELLPRSACGAKPVLTVDDFSTVVLSGSDVTWDAAAGVTGVVVTGWLAAVLSVVTAALAEVVAVLTA
jgi:hypothetical protein